ncbi:MAG: ABC transporter permease [Alphaproteobacteria bacterium]|jgi:ABC-2 type transport system permease protein|nr:ABC transporter permease [Alphaproteobacteria bacterium]|tara:strand:- start:48 stop:839 length:792 start_codon:yes stop_codon:yes gene_type:complete
MEYARPHIGAVNWLGVWTLYRKEVKRFVSVLGQTVLAPTVTSLIFLAIFSLVLGGAVRTVGDVPYLKFLAPGLIMMTIVQNSFANNASSMMISKIQGNIVDVLMPPLSAAELTFAYAAGGATRGLLVGLSVSLAMAFFAPIEPYNVAAIVFFALNGALMLSVMGLLAGIWAEKFDQLAVITNFIITPLAFLSGTFYSIERLPEIWRTLSRFDPFFYMIDGFRYGFIGSSDGSVVLGAGVLLAVNVGLCGICYTVFARGYKLKA